MPRGVILNAIHPPGETGASWQQNQSAYSCTAPNQLEYWYGLRCRESQSDSAASSPRLTAGDRSCTVGNGGRGNSTGLGAGGDGFRRSPGRLPAAPPGSCCLLGGRTREGRPLHIVCTTSHPLAIIITVYEPKPPKWATPNERGSKT